MLTWNINNKDLLILIKQVEDYVLKTEDVVNINIIKTKGGFKAIIRSEDPEDK